MIQTDTILPAAPVINSHQITLAREQSISRGISLVKALEEEFSGTPEELTAALGKMLHMPVLAMQDLHSAIPAFDLLPFAQAVKQECVLLQKIRSACWQSVIRFVRGCARGQKNSSRWTHYGIWCIQLI